MTENKRNSESVDIPLFTRGEIVETTIVDISHQGKGIGKINGLLFSMFSVLLRM